MEQKRSLSQACPNIFTGATKFLMETSRPAKLEDDKLVALAQKGEREAFEVLVERYQQKAYRIAFDFTRDREEAKDLSQEAFLRAFTHLKGFDLQASFYTWFYRILVNLCLDYRRRRGRISWDGPVHVKIVMNLALQILRLLVERDVEPAAVKNYGMEVADAEVVVAMGALLHDLGMSIHRPDHESYSLFLAERKLKELLPEVYDARTAAIIRSEILHAIISHRSGGRPLTLEAGVVRIADALDMAEGRSRIPFEKGSQSIHSISAAAIDGVRVEAGKEKPVRVRVQMTNSAGVFQLDRLFTEKFTGSGLEDWVELEASIEGGAEKNLLTAFRV